MMYTNLAAWKRTKHLSHSPLSNGNDRQSRWWWGQGPGAAQGQGWPGRLWWNRPPCASTVPLALAPGWRAACGLWGQQVPCSSAELAPRLESSRPTETYGQQMWRARGDPPRKYFVSGNCSSQQATPNYIPICHSHTRERH